MIERTLSRDFEQVADDAIMPGPRARRFGKRISSYSREISTPAAPASKALRVASYAHGRLWSALNTGIASSVQAEFIG